MSQERCRHLRTKAIYISAQADNAFNEESEPLCWCNQTFSELGPDDAPVHPAVCLRLRACFEPDPGMSV
jgi:hypothetical protein